MKRLLVTTAALLALGGVAHAGSWWTLDSQDGKCVLAASAARATRDPAFAGPFTLAAEMRSLGRSNGPTQMKRTAYGAAYAVPYDGVMTVYFASPGACHDFLRFAQNSGDLPR
jgi:hypothetical protein